MFVFGIVMALLGAVLPTMMGRLHLKTSDIGTLFLAMNAAMLVSSLVFGMVMDQFGMKSPLVLGPLLVAVALGIVIRTTALSVLLFAVMLLGIGGGALNGATNTLIADLHEDPRRKGAALNRLGIFFGFGALLLPFALGVLLRWLAVTQLLMGGAALCTVVGIFALLLQFPAPKQRQALHISGMALFLRSPLVIAFACLLFFESGVEFTLGGFISTYLVQDMRVASVSVASWILAAYWASIMVSRGVLSRIALGADPYKILIYCSLGACTGAILSALAPTITIAAIGVVMSGCSLAGIYPAALSVAGSRFGSHSGTVFGILLAVALAGGMALPWVAGQIGGACSLRWVFGMVAASFVAVLLFSRVAAHFDAGRPVYDTAAFSQGEGS
jgi:MFS transporter, FHS family, glucose/mannose:H+ symporter